MRLSISAIALFAMAGCGDGDLVTNPNVQRWCDERPCGWAVEGEIERVGTWHTHDFGVSLVSDDARLSQLNATASSHGGARCFEFTMVADVDAEALVYLELDFYDDGAVDFSQRLPPSEFELLRFLITAPLTYEKVRFILRKTGPGRAVLAELSAQTSYDCSAPPVVLARPDGAPCDGDLDGGPCE